MLGGLGHTALISLIREYHELPPEAPTAKETEIADSVQPESCTWINKQCKDMKWKWVDLY
jgi:hypothetical protein